MINYLKSPRFFLWQIVARIIDIISNSRLSRIGTNNIRYNLWKLQLNKLGHNTHIYPDVVIHNPGKVSIGSNVSIAEFVHMWGGGGISIANNVMIATQTVITSQTHNIDLDKRKTNVYGPVHIRENAWIGSGVIILPGITIGNGSVVAAGSVVTKDVPDKTVVAGSPAKVIRQICSATDPERV